MLYCSKSSRETSAAKTCFAVPVQSTDRLHVQIAVQHQCITATSWEVLRAPATFCRRCLLYCQIARCKSNWVHLLSPALTVILPAPPHPCTPSPHARRTCPGRFRTEEQPWQMPGRVISMYIIPNPIMSFTTKHNSKSLL